MHNEKFIAETQLLLFKSGEGEKVKRVVLKGRRGTSFGQAVNVITQIKR